MLMDMLSILLGFILLFVGGQILVNSSVALATSFKVSTLFISAFIIGFGTSLPELTISVGAMVKQAPDISIGNIVGSNIANILMVMGAAALISPILIPLQSVNRDVVSMLISSIILVIFMWLNLLNGWIGMAFLSMLIFYACWSFMEEQKSKHHEKNETKEENQQKTYKPALAILLSIIGIIALVVGADMLVDGAVSIALSFAISQTIIGLTIIAMGSSLPELVTAIIASFKKQGDVVLGNVIGSSIFNILGILGVTLLIQPIMVSPHIVGLDIWVMLGASVILAILILKKIAIGGIIGATMLLAYIVYLIWLYKESVNMV